MTMSQVLLSGFQCPRCSTVLESVTSGRVRCSRCGWSGEVYSFSPRVLDTQPAAAAMPEDATCLHHPRKKAVAVCAGTGDYICSLCAVELNGQTYSAEYLNSAGKNLAGKAFERSLPRPDSQIYLYLLCCFIPYVNFIFLPFAFIWIPHAVLLYFKTLRLREENPILKRIIGMPRMVMIPILLGLFALGWIAGVAAILIAVLKPRAFD
jgi:hypothetical protein